MFRRAQTVQSGRDLPGGKLEKLEKPERECHVSMVTWWGDSASRVAGSISSRFPFLRYGVSVLHIFPTQAKVVGPRTYVPFSNWKNKKERKWIKGKNLRNPNTNRTYNFFHIIRNEKLLRI